MQPLVSVVIPCYNHELFVRETIESVINQSYKNIELIIIDDGSRDGSVFVIQKMLAACKDRFVRFEFRSRPNKGLSETLNEALEWSRGDFFAPIASDDVLLPEKTSIQVEYLQKNTASIGVFGGVELIDSKSKNNKTVLRKAKKYDFKKIFLHEHFLPAPTQMLRRDAVIKVGGYKSELIIEDWSMWLLLTEYGGTLDYLRIVFARYRRHSENISSKINIMHASRKEVISFYSDSLLYNKSLSSIYLIAAHDWKRTDFIKSTCYMVQAINTDSAIVFTSNFLKYIVRCFLWWI